MQRVRMCSLGNIPASYRESMSYEEQVLWILNKMEKEIIPELNNVIDFLNNIDVNFDEINNKIDTINNQITTLTNNYDTLNERVNNISEELVLLANQLESDLLSLENELKDLINQNYNTLKSYVDSQDAILNNKIDNIVIGDINVYDPTTGELSPLQIVLNNLAQATYKDGLTASEFDTLELTASGFDAYNITALEFDSQGKSILV